MKKNVILLLAATFLFATVFTGVTLAKTVCKVTAVEGTKVTMDCGDKADDFDAGMKVTVKEKKATKAIEGC